MPRLFAALELPDDLAHDLAQLRGGLFGAKWIEESDLHLTLRFIGDIDARFAAEIEDELADIRKPAFPLTLERLDWFGGERPREIIVKAKATPELVTLQAKIETVMRRLGAPPEPRKFSPHVTLARLKGARVDDVVHYLAGRGNFHTAPFTVPRFVLLSSRDSVGDGPYLTEEVFPLREEITPHAAHEAMEKSLL